MIDLIEDMNKENSGHKHNKKNHTNGQKGIINKVTHITVSKIDCYAY